MPVRKQLLTLLLLSMSACPLTALADPIYTMTFLPQNVFDAVDNAGRIAVTFDDTAIAEAGLWSGGSSITGLGFLGTGRLSVAFDISTNGKVSGYSEISTGPNFGPHAFVYADGTMKDLGTLGGSRSIALAVNASGQAAGDSDSASGASHAFLYANGVMHDLGTLGGFASQANAINNAGVAVGSASLDGDVESHAYMTGAYGELIDLGTLPGGTISVGRAINDACLIAGTSNGTGFEDSAHAFLVENGVMTDIGTLGGPTTVQGMNNLGQVVGQSGSTAYLYANGQTVDLNSLIDPALGWHVGGAAGINDSQQVVAAVFKEGGGSRWVRLDLIPAVPEPAARAMWLAGLAWLGAGRRPRAAAGCPSPAASSPPAPSAIARHRPA